MMIIRRLLGRILVNAEISVFVKPWYVELFWWLVVLVLYPIYWVIYRRDTEPAKSNDQAGTISSSR